MADSVKIKLSEYTRVSYDFEDFFIHIAGQALPVIVLSKKEANRLARFIRDNDIEDYAEKMAAIENGSY